MGLTVKRVEALKTPGRYPDGFGLYLRERSATNKSWIFRYQLNGRERYMGLGPVHAFSLVEARNRARRARQLLADGIDPLDARRAERAETALAAAKTATFETCAAGYYDAVSDRWKNAKHRSQFLNTMEAYVYPVIGSLAVADIDVGLVLKVLQPIWKSKLETASRVRGRIEAVLNWATVRGYRTGDNPARWKGFLSTQLSARTERKHFSALPYTELPTFMAALRTRSATAYRSGRSH